MTTAVDRNTISKSTGRAWIDNNIFNYVLRDSGMYIIFYIIIPAITTLVSFLNITSSIQTKIAFYITIAITTMNCYYDARNRMEAKEKSVKNTKLILICTFSALTAIYCFVAIYLMSSTRKPFNWDGLLFVYMISMIIAFFDICCVFFSKLTFKNQDIDEFLND